MPQFSPIRQPFDVTGVDLVHPPDRMPPGRVPAAINVRSVLEGTATARPGYGAPLNPSPFDQHNVHSIRRMNNSLAGANPASRRFVGAGTKLYSVDEGLIDTGYSGNPLSLVVWRPDQSAEPWMYVGDSARMSKCRMNGATQTRQNWGIAPPRSAPTCEVGQPNAQLVDDFSGATAYSHGGDAGAASVYQRLQSTDIEQIIYDAGASGWCNIWPGGGSPPPGFGVGAIVWLDKGGANAEEVVIQEVHLQVSQSTIQGIKYDAGNTGPCTIQALTPLAGLDRNSIMDIDSGASEEFVTVLSYTIGPDGLYSFRCSCANTHVAGASLTGRPAIRVYTTGTHIAAEAIAATAMTSTITYSTGQGTLTKSLSVDGSQAPLSPFNTSPAGYRPLTPDDLMHVSLMMDVPANITQILIQLDVGDGSFTQNYYQINVQPNLAQALLSGTSTGLNALESAAQATLISEVVAPVAGPGFAGAAASPNVAPQFLQLYGGNYAWTEITVPLSELQRVGADTTVSLANIVAVRFVIQCSATVNFYVSSFWFGGGYGPDTTLPEAQFLIWRYRYRSSLTGAKSQQSPGILTGIQAHRQQVLISPALSADPQVDQIDIERFGGVLNEWHYAGTAPNAGTPIFADTYSDDELKNSPALEIDAVMPFPSAGVPLNGTCNVVGTKVTWASGAQFGVNWAPGQEILIAGIPYTVYGQPSSATSLTTVQNVGVLTGAPFIVAEPITIGLPLPYIIGPFDQGNFLLGWGDPSNPGTIYATKGNDPDSAPLSYNLELCSPSEPIVGGVIWDNNAIVSSTKRFWRISIDANAVASGQGNVLVKQELQIGRGLFAPWAICAGPLIWFLDEAGVPCETNGGQAVSIIEDDLRPLYPHDGVPGISVNGFYPPALAFPASLRMAYANGKVRFFFEDANNQQVNWDYDPVRKGWKLNKFNVNMNLAYWEEAESIDSELLCGQDGSVYQVGGFSDNGTAISCQVQLPFVANSRTEKFFGDAWVDADPQGVGNLTVQQIFDLGVAMNATQPLAGAGRAQFPLNTSNSNGQLARNAGLLVAWSSASAAPVLYEWQPWFWDTGTVLRTSWASLPTSHGLPGWQHLRDADVPLLMPSAGTVTLIVTIDGAVNFTALNLPLTPTANLLQKIRTDFPAAKGKMFEYQLQSGTPFLVFEKDLEVNCKSWGDTGPYRNVKPFGDG